jgi:hypothetical protein
MFHRHQWKIVEQHEQSAPIEIMRSTGVTNFKSNGWETWNDLATRDVIVTKRCETCGEEKVERV